MKLLPTIAIFLAVLSGCSKVPMESLQSDIDSIASHWIPDSRLALCDIVIADADANQLVLKGETTIYEAKDEIFSWLLGKGYMVLDSVLFLPDTSLQSTPWALVTVSVANLRKRPSHAAEMVSQAIMGTPMKIIKKKGGWLMVQTPDNYLSWVTSGSVVMLSDESLMRWKSLPRVVYMKEFGFVTEEESSEAIVCDLVSGSIVQVVDVAKNTFEIVLPDGRGGLINKSDCVDFNEWRSTVSLNAEKLVKTANRYMGVPYLWGGTSSKALDCSGFVKTVYFLNGTILQRDASQQFLHGELIDISNGFSNLKTGDLLFFGDAEPQKVTHVGMYTGNGLFIHESGRVRINSLDSLHPAYNDYLFQSLLGARRIIGQSPQTGIIPVALHDWY
jgi:hypothetical protein